MTGVDIRPNQLTDGESWLRCRVLSFLGTAYFDDVVTAKPTYNEPAIELVAVTPSGEVAGVLDVTLPREPSGTATIETVAVHPDHQRHGFARALLTGTASLAPC